jgi:hypothetical protein
MTITNLQMTDAMDGYVASYPADSLALADARLALLSGGDHALRQSFPMHASAGALLVRDGQILLVMHRLYGILLQPGGHLEPEDRTLTGAAPRELTEETGIDPACLALASSRPAYIEYNQVPPRPDKDEPAHYHLDFGYLYELFKLSNRPLRRRPAMLGRLRSADSWRGADSRWSCGSPGWPGICQERALAQVSG